MRHRVLAAIALALLSQACAQGEPDEPASVPTPSATFSSSSSPPVAPVVERRVIQVVVADGVVTSGTPEVSVDIGDNVRLEVTADIADVVVIEGYEHELPLSAGETGAIEFVADRSGDFAVGLEDAGLHLFELSVR